MNIEFQEAIDKRRLIRFPKGRSLIRQEMQAASDDLAEAEDRFEKEKYKYATITSYYSMFHTARALLYSKRYREKSHYYLLVALRALFVEKGLLEEALVRDFHDAMVLREDADYHGQFSEEGAASSIESAKRFIQKADSILRG